MKNIEKIIAGAKRVLEDNWRNNHTLPSPKTYPFQWNWDTGFIAIGYANFNVDKACEEFRSLFKGQWKNGFLPHIVFWDEAKSSEYFPGSSFYDLSRSPNAPQDISTSALTQPPIHGLALEYMYDISNRDHRIAQLIKELFIPIFNYHSYLYQNRDPNHEGLIYINHPWESGTDNSPVWDDILNSMKSIVPSYDIPALRKDTRYVNSTQRPGNYEYQCYLYLIDLFKKANYDDTAIFENTPFAVQDPLFNSLLIRSNEALINLSGLLGFDDKKDEIRSWNEKSIVQLNTKLYKPETGAYAYFDLKSGKSINKLTSSCLIPLITSAPEKNQIESMIGLLTGPEFSGEEKDHFLCPSYDSTAVDFDKKRYWRGPVWVNMNWLLIQGLKRHGHFELADKIIVDTIDLILENGFFEYFDPKKEKAIEEKHGYGSDRFSWTASLLIDLYYNHLKE